MRAFFVFVSVGVQGGIVGEFLMTNFMMSSAFVAAFVALLTGATVEAESEMFNPRF